MTRPKTSKLKRFCEACSKWRKIDMFHYKDDPRHVKGYTHDAICSTCFNRKR